MEVVRVTDELKDTLCCKDFAGCIVVDIVHTVAAVHTVVEGTAVVFVDIVVHIAVVVLYTESILAVVAVHNCTVSVVNIGEHIGEDWLVVDIHMVVELTDIALVVLDIARVDGAVVHNCTASVVNIVAAVQDIVDDERLLEQKKAEK